ncbi:MAG TPA: twin transmembrane helix small protein [Xanthobacteraceae bacterium]|jgi:hypothetical protein|nr:twin transmembrane helix small protein [Xanthobacteraceae bacterium]
MTDFLSTYIVPMAIAAVAVVLMLGLYNMLRGGSPSLSQKLMRWRVVLQFIAIIIIMLTVWAMGR